ncbi:hypothetical protein IDH27_03220 [Pelagibacterales bacterium SAG-MED46]|nr:hypothetical protein [Pelagibacterales bacterium SAG-MED46]
MLKIQEFILDRNKSIETLNSELKKFIKDFSINSEITEILNWISFKTKISKQSITSDTEIFIFRQFINAQGKFNKVFELKNIFYDSIKFLMYFIYIRLFSKKKTKEIKCEICVDDISHGTSPDRFEFINEISDTIFVSSTKLNKKYKTFHYSKYLKSILSKDVCNNLTFYFVIFIKTLKSSIKLKANLFPLITRLVLTYIKYETVFSIIKAKFLIQERHYGTSSIKNEIFHKHGGKISSVIQKNILQVNGPGMYINSDILFSLGDKSADNLKKLGGNVKKIISVGSLFMERGLYKRKDVNKFEIYDLLVFASNHDGSAHSGYNSYYDDYYTHFEWIKKFSKEFPKFEICIKLKKILTDQKVKKLFDECQNIHIIIDTTKEISDTYYIADKAKALCTWSSTLGYEFIGSGKECYFLDPNLKNTGFIPNDEFILPTKVKNYEEFKEKIVNKILGKNDDKILINKEKFCFPSQNVSKSIIDHLRNLENDQIFN